MAHVMVAAQSVGLILSWRSGDASMHCKGGSVMLFSKSNSARDWRRGMSHGALLAFALLASSPAFSAEPYVPFAPTPDTDSFYAQPQPFPNLPVGTILESRKITFKPTAGVPMLNKAWRLKYVSRDQNDRPIAAVATVVKPVLQFGPRKLVSYQYAEDSLGLGCAPSHQVAGEIIPNFSFSSQLEPAQYLIGLKTLGWTVVIPDHQGPNSTYAAGKVAGQITLDGIRAALSFEPLDLSRVSTPVGMWGYSRHRTSARGSGPSCCRPHPHWRLRIPCPRFPNVCSHPSSAPTTRAPKTLIALASRSECGAAKIVLLRQ
ncbi:MAG: lipase family protein [Pseudoxanthomonas sp.]